MRKQVYSGSVCRAGHMLAMCPCTKVVVQGEGCSAVAGAVSAAMQGSRGVRCLTAQNVTHF